MRCASVRPTNASFAVCASPPCQRIAVSRSVARPSCKKRSLDDQGNDKKLPFDANHSAPLKGSLKVEINYS
ncbi:hypothetical protein V6256_10970 [Psychromonas aquatilis]|uniref:Uncharacterized protein n=1 Tax=Psychromonas aquatilis TaxID=2005072 RepID=A0ABU9GS22_9GAMM